MRKSQILIKKHIFLQKNEISMNFMSSQTEVIALNNTKFGNLVAQYIFIWNHKKFLVKDFVFQFDGRFGRGTFAIFSLFAIFDAL